MIEPYGVDISARLVDLARERLPQWHDRFWVGNAMDWIPPNGQRFTYVHALFDFWPAQRWPGAIAHVLSLVEPGGRLLMSQYGAGSAAAHVLSELGYEVLGTSASTAWISPS
jgi:trans-aconitate methyltransferase